MNRKSKSAPRFQPEAQPLGRTGLMARLGVFVLSVLGMVVLAVPAAVAAEPAPEFLTQFGENCGNQIKIQNGECGAAGETAAPRGLATDADNGHLFVSDQTNKRVDEFTPWGNFVKAWGWDVVATGPGDDTSAPVDQLEVCVPAEGDVCKAGLEGSGAGQITGPQGIAVDSQGDVYVHDLDSNRVQKFDSEGNFLAMIGGGVNQGPGNPGNLCTAAHLAEGDVCGAGSEGTGPGEFTQAIYYRGSYVAVGPDDTVYVGDKERIQKFNPDGSFDSQIALPAPMEEASVSSLAVGPAGEIFLAGYEDGFFPELGRPRQVPDVLKLTPAGALSCTIAVARPTALAADGAGGVYVFHSSETSQTAPEFNVSEIRHYDAGCEALSSFADHDFGKAPGSDRVTGIAVNALGTVYASNASLNSYIRAYGTPPVAFEAPPPADPEILDTYALAVGSEEAALGAKVNPHFWTDATVWVEYGLADCEGGGCSATDPVALTTKSVNGAVSSAPVELDGLAPGTTYHYRFLATSGGGGPVAGPGRSFRTYPVSAPGLPDGRVHELVSPPDKGGGEVAVPTAAGGGADFSVQPQQASLSGEAITYASFTSFGEDPQSAPAASQYLSTRGPAGWSTENINPRFEEGFTRDPLVGFSSDLSHGIVIALEPELTEDAAEDVPNLYRRDNLSGALTAMTTTQPLFEVLKSEYCIFYGGASEDSGRIFLGAKGALLPGDPVKEHGFNLYEWSEAQGLSLVSVLPDGSKAVPGETTRFGATASFPSCGGSAAFKVVRHSISADGSKAFWTYGGTYEGITNPLFARVNGSTTIRLDAPNEGVSGKGAGGTYWDASTDGSKVFFTAAKKLTSESTAAGATDLYRYDFEAPEGERLANLSALTGEGAQVQGVIGASAEGDFVYFAAKGVLAPGAISGENNLYVWHQGEGVRFLAGLGADDDAAWDVYYDNHRARVSPDGRHLAFLSKEPLTGFDNSIAAGGCVIDAEGNRFGSPLCAEVFLYDYDADALDCASCNAASAKPLGPASLPGWSTPYEQPRYLSDSGRLFFETYDALSPHDTNGTQDVYEFQRPGSGSCEEAEPSFNPASGGCVELISTGTSGDVSYFLDASADGEDAFISTRQGLVFYDADGRYDVYDARVGGATPQPPAPPCEGEACREGSTSPPLATPPGSGTLRGAGNPKPRRGCPKGKRAVRKAGKTRCVKKHRKHGKRRHKKHQQRLTHAIRRTHR